MANWGELPSVILLEILCYLNKRDRLSCGVVCKHWYETMCNPLVWKSLTILLDSDLTDPLTMVVVKRFAPHITSLDMTWSRSYLPRRWLRNRLATVAHDTMNFLIQLKDCDLGLIAFKVNDWYFTWKYKRVICNLSTFLKTQRRLQSIDLSNAYLNKNDILKILKGCEGSYFTIKSINLLGSFHEWHNVALNPAFANIMKKFENLEVLKLDYSSFSDNILNSFIENKNISLKYIEINIKESDNRSHVISPILWKKLTETCQDLRAGVNICNICHYGDIYYMLIDTIPLQSFILNCPNVWDMTRSRRYCGTISLLSSNYESTLTHLTLYLRNNREIVDECLLELIKKCKMLEYMEFDGIIQNANFVRDICELQFSTNDSKFKYFHVRPRNANLLNNVKISQIWRNYVNYLHNKQIRFEVETLSNPTVRIYC